MKKGIDFIGVGVGAMIFNNEGKVFLAKRGEKVRNEKFFWEFPGGAVIFGEKLYDAIKREFKEEYGIEIRPIELLCVADHILKIEKQHWVSPTFIGLIDKGEPQINEPNKCAEIGWFNLDNLPSPLMSVSENDVTEYKKRYGETPYNEILEQRGNNEEI
jgi:8-oxo-dGTP diphosphatase